LKLWKDCQPLSDVDQSDQTILFKILNKLQDAFATGNSDQLGELLNARLLDQALAFGRDPVEKRRDVVDFAKELASEPGWGLEPFKQSDLNWDLVAEKRAVWITRFGHEPVIKSKRLPTFAWSSHVYAAKIDGQWVIIR
jgi:hypothetical protein